MLFKLIKSKKAALGWFGATLLLATGQAFAASGDVLKPDDFVGISFWLISMALVASTAFSFWNATGFLQSGKPR
jgi:hypothetical protein